MSRRPRWIWARVILFTILAPGLLLAIAPYFWIITPRRVAEAWPPGAARAPALVVIALGITIYGTCAWRFATEGWGTPAPYDPPRRLVTGGWYRWTRNPMYIGIAVALVGEAWMFASPPQMVYAALVALAFHARVVLYEEPRLSSLFGEEFWRYRASVRRWGWW